MVRYRQVEIKFKYSALLQIGWLKPAIFLVTKTMTSKSVHDHQTENHKREVSKLPVKKKFARVDCMKLASHLIGSYSCDILFKCWNDAVRFKVISFKVLLNQT